MTDAEEVVAALRDEVPCIECLAAVKSREAEWLFRYPYHTRCLDIVLAAKDRVDELLEMDCNDAAD